MDAVNYLVTCARVRSLRTYYAYDIICLGECRCFVPYTAVKGNRKILDNDEYPSWQHPAHILVVINWITSDGRFPTGVRVPTCRGTREGISVEVSAADRA